MNAEQLFPYLPVAIFAIVIGYFVFRLLKYGGFKGAMFGARVTKTVGEVSGSGGRLMTTVVRVHVLEGGAEGRDVGLEIARKGTGSYSVSPVSLSLDEAKKLSQYLQSAVENRTGWN